MWYAAAAEHLVSRGQPVVTSVTGESRATGPFNLSTNTSQQTSESKGASHTQVSTYLWTLHYAAIPSDIYHGSHFLAVQLFQTEIFGDRQLLRFTFDLYLGTS